MSAGQRQSVSKKKATAKGASKRTSHGDIHMTIETGRNGRSGSTVKFGSVTIRVGKASDDEITRNVDLGRSALERAKKRIVKPGVNIRFPKGVPHFFADPEHPRRLVRVLDGKRDRGVFENGRFKVTG